MGKGWGIRKEVLKGTRRKGRVKMQGYRNRVGYWGQKEGLWATRGKGGALKDMDAGRYRNEAKDRLRRLKK